MSFAMIVLALSSPPFAAVPLTDSDLDGQRGGFRLPNGIEVSIAVDTQTAVNGAVVLRTAFRADQGPPTVTVYVPKAGVTVPQAPAAGGSATSGAASPTVTYDARNGLQVTPPTGSSLNVRLNAGGTSSVPEGLEAVTPGGGIATDAGTVSAASRSGVDTVSLTAGDLTISHFAGDAFGSAVINAGNDRSIDTDTSLSITLSNTSPDTLGSAMFRVDDVATQALQTRIN